MKTPSLKLSNVCAPVKERPKAQLANRAIHLGTFDNFGKDFFDSKDYDETDVQLDPDTGEIVTETDE